MVLCSAITRQHSWPKKSLGEREGHLGTHFGISAVNFGQPLALCVHVVFITHVGTCLDTACQCGQRQGQGSPFSTTATAMSISQFCSNCLLPYKGWRSLEAVSFSARQGSLIPKKPIMNEDSLAIRIHTESLSSFAHCRSQCWGRNFCQA